jgi:ABC-type branched-subunit amino acid transport system ATPase component
LPAPRSYFFCTFQINQLFGDLAPLETLTLAVSERLGLGTDVWSPVGMKAQIVDEVTEILQRWLT